jgi:hypothetical protein
MSSGDAGRAIAGLKFFALMPMGEFGGIKWSIQFPTHLKPNLRFSLRQRVHRHSHRNPRLFLRIPSSSVPPPKRSRKHGRLRCRPARKPPAATPRPSVCSPVKLHRERTSWASPRTPGCKLWFPNIRVPRARARTETLNQSRANRKQAVSRLPTADGSHICHTDPKRFPTPLPVHPSSIPPSRSGSVLSRR